MISGEESQAERTDILAQNLAAKRFTDQHYAAICMEEIAGCLRCALEKSSRFLEFYLIRHSARSDTL